MDSPGRPPDFACDDGTSTIEASGCDEPKTIGRDAGSLVQEAIREFVGIALVAPFLMWILGTVTRRARVTGAYS